MKNGRRVQASVPAKAILFGEHFVVYGKRALATAINKRLTVIVSEREARGYHVKIANIPTFGLQVVLEPGKREAQPYKDFGSATNAIAYVKSSIEYLEREYGIGGDGVEIEINSEIPLSAGLGSSAATCVATIAALKHYFDVGSDSDLEAIRTDAHRVEKTVQGNASPVDTAISTYGGYVLIERTRVKRLQLAELDLIIGTISSIPLSMDLKLTSGISLKTKRIVEEVKARRDSFEAVFKCIFDAADELTVEAVRALEHGEFARLGALMNINHGLLDAIGVVPGRLSELVKLSQQSGALGAKVTGAGGVDDLGGVGSVLVLPGESRERIKAAMTIAGALVMEVKTAEDGLKMKIEQVV
ncbi:MAG: mevalonate kinase [Halobacteriota archaeon]